MIRFTIFGSLIFTVALSSCAQTNKSAQQKIEVGQPIAFPGAEGFGKYTTGGRGGKVYIVTNVNDKGPGSFREAAEAKEKRIIVFAVSGTIHLETNLSIKGDCTIAGQTAPGDGICFADRPVSLGGNNIIVRYLRFRMGDRFQNAGMVDGSGHDDAFSGSGKKNIIIDHCSMSWSTDEVFSVYNGDSTTLQWNLIAEPLNYSYHFEKGDKDFERHGYGGIWGGKHFTGHHNLFAHCVSRNPRFSRSSGEDLVDFRNNVIYNWEHNNIYAGEGGNFNMVNNYFKYGPGTKKNVMYRIVNPGRQENPPIGFGRYYVDGNYVDGNEETSKNNWLGIHMGNGGTEEDKKQTVVATPFPVEEMRTQSAKDAYEDVLKTVGASYKRDSLDDRVVKNVLERTGRFIDVQGGYPHGTAYEQTVNAWPRLESMPAPLDSDKDGMADEWEKKNGLNPADASDNSGFKLSKQYTNIEVYFNSLVK